MMKHQVGFSCQLAGHDMTIHAIHTGLFYGTLYIVRTAVSRNIKRRYRCSPLWKWHYAQRGVECRPAVQSAIYLWRFLAGWWSDAVADADNCCGGCRWLDDLGAHVVCLSTHAFHLLVAANSKHPGVSFRSHGAPSIQHNISSCYRIYHAQICVFRLIHLCLYLSTFVRAATACSKRRSVELFCLPSFALFVVLTSTGSRRHGNGAVACPWKVGKLILSVTILGLFRTCQQFLQELWEIHK